MSTKILTGLREQVGEIEQPKNEWLSAFEISVVDSENLQKIQLSPREEVLGKWFKQGDLGYIYALRGIGKTWFAMHLACAIASGGQAGCWKSPKPRTVLYVDGEMPIDDTKARDALLKNGQGNVLYLHHELLFERTGKILNLADSEIQNAIFELCQSKGVKILFLDNLSCLFSGIKENESDAWEGVLPWLLRLRRERIAVVFIHHTGKSGCHMRGTSRREDAAFWCIRLSEARVGESQAQATTFVSQFEKNRNGLSEDAPSLQWEFRSSSDSGISIDWKELSKTQLFRQLIEEGVTSCSELAEEMRVSKGTISKLAKKGVREGWLRSLGKDGYELVSSFASK